MNKTYARTEKMSTLEDLASRAEECGHHMNYRSPFQSPGAHFLGFTKQGVTGWNGRPDHLVAGEDLDETIASAAKLLDRIAAAIEEGSEIDDTVPPDSDLP